MNPAIMSEIMQLSVNERLQIVEDIWDSIQRHPEDLLVTNDEKKILDLRLEAFQRHPEQTITWENMKANILSAMK